MNSCDSCTHYEGCGYFDRNNHNLTEEERFIEHCVGCCCGDGLECNRAQGNGCSNWEDNSKSFWKSDGIGTAWGRFDPELMPFTLQIDTNLIKLRHKEMDIEFDLEPGKLENIDTIIINGHKYVKEN